MSLYLSNKYNVFSVSFGDKRSQNKLKIILWLLYNYPSGIKRIKGN